jgi:L-ascorbate metabolism protein UlaG (beta-lactamase superfamily)
VTKVTEAVAEIARRVGPVDVAVLFVGAARVPSRERGRPLMLTGERAGAAAAVLGAPIVIPAHYDGWAHFTEGRAEIDRAFDDAGLSGLLRGVDHGSGSRCRPERKRPGEHLDTGNIRVES